jgi:hypothetical protein
VFKSLEPTADGGFVVAGGTESFGAGATDAWVFKLDGNGNVVWQWTFGGTGTDSANAVHPTTDGGYIVAGSMSGPGSYERTWVLKLDASGGVVWQRQYAGGAAASVKQSADGGYVVAAASDSLDFLETGTDYWILKLDASGSVTWQKTYARTLNDSYSWLRDQPTVVYTMTDGGYLIAGVTSPQGAPIGRSGWLLRLDASGNVVWSKEYPGWVASVQPIDERNFVVAGNVRNPSDIYKINPWVMKVDSSGNAIWQRYIPDEEGRDTFSTAQPTADGGYVVVGTTSPNEDGVTSARALKLGSDGAVADCANLAPYDRTSSDSGVITRNTAVVAVATEIAPAISHAVPILSTATLIQLCGSTAISTGRDPFR